MCNEAIGLDFTVELQDEDLLFVDGGSVWRQTGDDERLGNAYG